MSSNIHITRICQHCNNEFTARTTVTKYCGDNCAKRAYKLRNRTAKIEASKKETDDKRIQRVEILKVKEFLTVRDVATLLNCSLRTAYRLIDQGNIKAINLSQRKTLIKRTDIDIMFV